MTTLTNAPGFARGANTWSGSAGWIPSARGPQARRLAFEARQARAAREAAAVAATARAAREATAPVLVTDAALREEPLIIVHPPRVSATEPTHAAPRPAACARPAACGGRARAAARPGVKLTAA